MAAKESIKYGTRNQECYRIYDNSLGFVDRTNARVRILIEKWQQIENFEYSKRLNGKTLSKIVLMFPNKWSEAKKEKVLEEFLKEKFNDNHDFTFCFHNGRDGEVNHNSHGHLYYSERKLNDEKRRKDASMSKLGYVKKFVADWQKVCGIDLKKYPKVPRIPMMQWKANSDEARKLKVKQKADVISRSLEIFNLQKEILSLSLQSRRIIRNKKHIFNTPMNVLEDHNTWANQDLHLQNDYLIAKEEKERKSMLSNFISEILSKNHILNLRTFISELDAHEIFINHDPERGFIFETSNAKYRIESSDLSIEDQNILDDFAYQHQSSQQMKR